MFATEVRALSIYCAKLCTLRANRFFDTRAMVFGESGPFEVRCASSTLRARVARLNIVPTDRPVAPASAPKGYWREGVDVLREVWRGAVLGEPGKYFGEEV